jgi:hypothetical protein
MSADSNYEVTLGPAAERVIMRARYPRMLAAALRTELIDGPNAHNRVEFGFDDDGNTVYPGVPGGVVYTAVPLSFNAYTALYRPMAKEELDRLTDELGRPVADRGCYIVDVLSAESSFSRPRLEMPPGRVV